MAEERFRLGCTEGDGGGGILLSLGNAGANCFGIGAIGGYADNEVPVVFGEGGDGG